MIAKNIVSGLIPPLKTSDQGDKALIWMQEFGVGQLPIVDDRKYIGLIGEEDILDFSDPNACIKDYKLSLPKAAVNQKTHLLDVLKIAAEMHLTVIPVVDDEDLYCGLITLEGLMQAFAKMSSATEPGGVLILEMNTRDYSLQEISRLVESNDAFILSSSVRLQENSTKMEVTLKLNLTDLKHIVATFERFEYKVAASYQQSSYVDQLRDNYNALMNYLDL